MTSIYCFHTPCAFDEHSEEITNISAGIFSDRFGWARGLVSARGARRGTLWGWRAERRGRKRGIGDVSVSGARRVSGSDMVFCMNGRVELQWTFVPFKSCRSSHENQIVSNAPVTCLA